MGAEGIGPSWRAWHDGFTDRPGSIPVYAPDNVVRVVGLEPTSPGWKPGILGQLDEARLCCCSVSWSPCRESNPIGRATRAAALREHEGGCFPFWRAAEVSILAKLDLESNPDAGPQPELNATKYFVIARISSDRSVGLIYSSAGMARPGAAPEGVVFVGPAPRSVPPGTAGRGGAGRAGRVNVGCFCCGGPVGAVSPETKKAGILSDSSPWRVNRVGSTPVGRNPPSDRVQDSETASPGSSLRLRS